MRYNSSFDGTVEFTGDFEEVTNRFNNDSIKSVVAKCSKFSVFVDLDYRDNDDSSNNVSRLLQIPTSMEYILKLLEDFIEYDWKIKDFNGYDHISRDDDTEPDDIYFMGLIFIEENKQGELVFTLATDENKASKIEFDEFQNKYVLKKKGQPW